MTVGGFIKRGISAGTATALVVGTLTGLAILGVTAAPSASADPAPIAQPGSNVVTADALPTVQIDGVVWSQVVVGNTVYAGGSFTTARPAGSAAGQNTVPRTSLLAYDITTGALISSFAPTLNGQVRSLAVSPDHTRLYAAGDFTQVNGATHNRIVAFNLASGAVVSAFKGGTNSSLRSVVATNSTVYVGGLFATANGVARKNLAAFQASDGALTAWAPSADYKVNALTLTPSGSRIVVGGAFANISGHPAYGMGMVDAVSGAFIQTDIDSVVRDAGTEAAILSLTVDANAIYGTGYVFGSGGNFEGTFSADPTTGDLNWMEDCHGDTYGAFSTNGIVYTVSHAHFCANVGGWPVYDPWQFRHSLAFTANATGTLLHNSMGGYADFYGQPSPTLLNWFPDFTNGTYTGQNQAAWSVTGNSQYVVEGGEFPTVNGTAQQGLVRFAVRPIAPGNSGPRVTGAHFVPSLVSLSTGTVRVAFESNWDRDSKTLHYQVVRDNDTAHPVFETDADSEWWNTPTIGFVDTGLAPGSTHKYRVIAIDPDGNRVAGDNVTITLPTSGTQTAYDQKVIADGASSYWPLSESSGSVFVDNAAFNDMDVSGSVTRGVTGPVSGESATAFDGSTASSSTRSPIPGPNTFTLSAWVNTTSSSGGKILGFGNAQSGESSAYDRHLYLDNSGHVWFGVYNNTVSTINSSQTINDGQWHQVVASLGADGMSLYVDGLRVAHRSDVTSGQDYSGYWRIGGDNLGAWTNRPTSDYLAGSIGDVAIFPTVLTRGTVQDEFVASGRSATIPPAPTDAYGQAVYNDEPDLYWRLDDASGPTAADTSPNISNGTYSGGVSYRTPSPVTGSGGTGVTFNGSNGTIGSQQQFTNPTVYSEEAWFNTTTTHGGKIIGFGNQQSGNSGSYDRHVYMTNDGRLNFGVWTGTTNIATTPNSYNDGQWHQVVATQGSDGMKLYVDGTLQASNPQTQAQGYTGYWRVGGDSDWGGDSPYFAGSIDEVSVYSHELTAAQVSGHYGASPVSPNQPPIAAFSHVENGLTASFTASDSSDPDGTIASYAWDFGDGNNGSGESPDHPYGAAGTYSVKLTVTDNDGAVDSVTQDVTVSAVVAADAFSRSVTGGWGSADTGGAWTRNGSAALFAVGNGAGTIKMASAGSGPSAYLNGVSARDVDALVDVSIDKAPTGNGVYTSLDVRHSGTTEYRLQVKLTPTGVVLALIRVVSGTQTTLATKSISGLTYNPGDVLRVRFDANGTGTTTLSAKVWKTSSTEPANWQVTATDSTVALQSAGAVGVMAYLATNVTNAPVVASFDNLAVGPIAGP